MGQAVGCCGGRDAGPDSNMEKKGTDGVSGDGTAAAGVAVVPSDKDKTKTNGTGSTASSKRAPTDPVAAALLHSQQRAAAASLEAKSGGPTPLVHQTVAAVDTSAAGGLRPSESIRAALWEKFFHQTMSAYSRIGEKHMSLIGPDPPSEQQKKELATLTEEVQHEVTLNMAHLLGTVFDHYDRNKSMDLDTEELTHVIEDYADAAQLALAKCLDQVFAPEGRMMKAALDMRARLQISDAQLQTEISGLKQNLSKDMATLSVRLSKTKAASARLVKELMSQFDTNQDGKISRKEFIDNFHKLAESLSISSGPLAIAAAAS